VTPTRWCSSDREMEWAGPRASPHRGAPVRPVRGRRRVVRHPVHGGHDSEKTGDRRRHPYRWKEIVATGWTSCIGCPFICSHLGGAQWEVRVGLGVRVRSTP
jgi:hypothetical protein